MAYEAIYKMKPLYEDRRRGGVGWYKLQWRPIWRETFSIYCSKCWRGYRQIGFEIGELGSAHNGWGRYYDRLNIDVFLWLFSIHFWVHYNFIVHRDGPLDVSHPKPLVLTGKETIRY